MLEQPILTGQDDANITRVPHEQAVKSELEKPAPDPTRPDLQKYLLELIEAVRKDGYTEKLKRLRKWVRNAKTYEGDHYGYISPHTGRWVDGQHLETNPNDTDEDLEFVNNQFRFHVKSVKKEWVRSQTRLKVRARSDKAQKVGAAEFASSIVEDYQRRLFDEFTKQAEAMYAFLYGNYFRYTYYTSDTMGAIERLPLFENKQVELSPATFECAACGQGGALPPEYIEGSGCPICAYPEIEIAEPVSMDAEVPTGEFQEVKVGDSFTEIPNPMEINVHLHSRKLSQSPYLHREREVLRAVLKAKFKNANLKGGIWDGDNGSASTIRQMESTVGNVGANNQDFAVSAPSSNPSPFELLKFDQIWLDPPVYADYITKQDEKISDGTLIPAGTSLGEVFSRGLYIAAVGSEIVNLRNENKSEGWVHGVLDLIPHRFWGDGLEDMVELQYQLNEVINLRFENMMANAAPNTIFNPLRIDPEGFSGKPREMTALINANPDDDIRKFVMRLEGTGLDRENFAAEDGYKKDMQTLSGAFSINSGMPDADITTATGARIVRDAAVSMIGPALAIRASVDVEWAYQVLSLAKRFWTAERYIPQQGKHGALAGQWFSAADIEGDFEIIYEPGSWMPRSEMDEREDFLSFISPQATGLPLGFLNPMVPERLRQKAAELYRMPIDLDETRVHQRIAYARIEKLMEAAELLVQGGMLDPMFDFEAMPPPQPVPTQTFQGVTDGPNPVPPATTGDAGAQPPSPPMDANRSQLVTDPLMGDPMAPTGTAPMGPMMVDPNLLMLQELLALVPVRIVVDEHLVFANTYREWLTTDDGLKAPTAVQKVLETKIVEHFLAQGQVQGYMEQMAGAFAAPAAPNAGAPPGASPPSGNGGQKPGKPPTPASGSAPHAAQNPAPKV